MAESNVFDVLRARGMSSRGCREALEAGKVRLHGVPIGDGLRLVDPETITVAMEAPRTRPGLDLVVVHRDESWVIVHKPSGMLSVPAPKRKEPDAVHKVSTWFGSAYAVHRLDEDTSGLLVVARTEAAQEWLKDKFERHEVERRYLAFAAGAFPQERSISTTLVRDRGDGLRGSGPGGKPATTHFTAREPLRHATLIEARLETGRTHQVRIHAAELGHAILGDSLYAKGPIAHATSRLALHAWQIAFTTPDGRRIDVRSPLPDDLERWRRAHALGAQQPTGPDRRRPTRR